MEEVFTNAFAQFGSLGLIIIALAIFFRIFVKQLQEAQKDNKHLEIEFRNFLKESNNKLMNVIEQNAASYKYAADINERLANLLDEYIIMIKRNK